MNPKHLIAAAMILLPPILLLSIPSTRERLLHPMPTGAGPQGARDVHPVAEEPPASAVLPLDQAVDRLDYLHDPKAEAAFGVIVQSRLRREEFEALDALAVRFRTTKERFPGGGWKLETLVSDLGNHPQGQDAPESAWLAHLALMDRWMQLRPFSPTAPVVAAAAWTSYAWKARGTGYANTVSNRMDTLMRQRLTKAKRLLEEAAVGGAARCPSWFARMQEVALGEGWEPADFERLFNEAVAQEPLYRTYYRKRAYALLPRWYGEEGDWEKFMAEACDKLGGEDGDEMYYYVADFMEEWYETKEYLARPSVSWDRMKRGFWVVQTRRGMTLHQANRHGSFTDLTSDQEEAKKVLALIGAQWDPTCWNDRAGFDRWATWASGPLDMPKPPPSQSPDAAQGGLGAQAAGR